MENPSFFSFHLPYKKDADRGYFRYSRKVYPGLIGRCKQSNGTDIGWSLNILEKRVGIIYKKRYIDIIFINKSYRFLFRNAFQKIIAIFPPPFCYIYGDGDPNKNRGDNKN